MDKINEIVTKIDEKWIKGTKSTFKKEYREIFKNPSKEELLQLDELGIEKYGENIRFIAINKSKNIYVTSADVFHTSMKREIPELVPEDFTTTFSGAGGFKRGKVEVTWWTDELNDPKHERSLYNICKEVILGDYDWIERYNFELGLFKQRAKKEVLRMGVVYEED